VFPLPIARVYRRYLNAAETGERHHNAYYLFEVYLKYVASIAIAHYLAGSCRDHRVNAALKGLVRPSLGEWLRFLRECLTFLGSQREETPAAIKAIASVFGRKETRWPAALALYNAIHSWRTDKPSTREKLKLEALLSEIVTYRNRVLGHGAPMAEDHYRRFGQLFADAFDEVLELSPFLTGRRRGGSRPAGGRRTLRHG